jgi:hypothetical protein
MANEIKYENVTWAEGTPIEGERLATNSFYTGQHKGTPTQDALDGADNDPYLNERNTVRLGTILGDAEDENFPTVDDSESENDSDGE